jgi:RND superfamily putative drug exporter
MFGSLGTIVSRRWPWALLGWTVLVLAVACIAPRWDDLTCDGDFAYLPAEMSSVQAEKLLEAAFPDVLSRSNLVLIVAREHGPLEPADVAVANRLIDEFTPRDESGPIVDVLSHQTPVIGEKLVSEPGPAGQATLIVLQLRNEFMAIGNMPFVKEIYGKLAAMRHEPDFPQGLTLGVSGSAAIGADMLFSAEESIRNTELATCFLVVMILLVVYRAPGLVVVPLLTIFLSLMVATGLVAIVSLVSQQSGWFDFKIFKTTRIFVVVILYGAVTDYCLFLISRYREQLQSGLAPAEAIASALGSVGNALVGSALTTIVGLGCMAFADFGKFRNSGPAIALCLVVAMVASLTLAPALLRATGLAVFWPLGIATQARAPGDGTGRAEADRRFWRLKAFWPWLSRQIVTRPGLILVASLVLLAPLAYHGLSVEVTYDLLAELQDQRPSVRGTRLLGRYFAAGEIGPVTVLAYQETGQFATGSDRWQKIGQLAETLHGFEYRDSEDNRVRPITSVRSLAEPLGDRPAQYGLFSGLRKGVLRGHHRTKNTYLAQAEPYRDKVTRLDLVFTYDPFSIESIRLLDHLEAYLRRVAEDSTSPWYGTQFYFRGTTAGIRDLRAVTASDQLLIQQLVTLAVLGVLVLLIGRPLVSSYLVLSVLFGYFVTIGTCMLLFSWLYGDTFHGLDWKVPIFLFVILIAIGEDYNIYLVTRVFEEQERRGPIEGVRVALTQTGGIITSCGVIMAGTFIAMTAGTLRAMHELGFALALGVLLDTLVIRTVLVPAFLVLRARRQPARQSSPKPASSESDPRTWPPRRQWPAARREIEGK